MKPNTKKLLTALFFLMIPSLMSFTLSFLMPTQANPWVSLLQNATLYMACGTSAAGGMALYAFIHAEAQEIQQWKALGAIEAQP